MGLAGLILMMATLACTLPGATGPDGPAVATQVAATLTSLAPTEGAAITATSAATETAIPTEEPAPSASPAPSATPPSDGVSLNCDNSYQRIRLVNPGESGQALVVDQWNGSGWEVAWQYDGGDPVIRQLTEDAGAYMFGSCQQLLVVPLLYSGSGGILELKIFQWTGDDANEVYANDGSHGNWSHDGARVRLERALYLYNEPNCCPCNREGIEHEWNGASFVEVESEIIPTYSGTPPPVCQQ